MTYWNANVDLGLKIKLLGFLGIAGSVAYYTPYYFSYSYELSFDIELNKKFSIFIGDSFGVYGFYDEFYVGGNRNSFFTGLRVPLPGNLIPFFDRPEIEIRFDYFYTFIDPNYFTAHDLSANYMLRARLILPIYRLST